MLLEKFLPSYDFREFHQVDIPAPADRVFEAIKECTPAELPIMRLLMAIRLLPARLIGRSRPAGVSKRSLLQAFIDGGFLLLGEQRDREIVLGRIGQFWKLTGGEYPRVIEPDAFVRFNRGGFAKAATNLLIEARQDGSSVLSTETRIAATDASTRRKFGAYWAIIHPGSAVIRREWLRSIRRRAIAAAN
jgi:hypothetical protein